jgi:membrane-associated phospholipid phosphatase
MIFLSLFLSTFAFADVDDSVRNAVKWNNTELAAQISDYAVLTSVAGTLGYTAIHNKEKRWERTGIVAGAYVANIGLNKLVKVVVARERPGKQNRESFYSGHTSSAFVGAGAMCLQDDKALCVSALGLAAMVGYLRIAADWHWFSDVAVGAGIGYAFGRYVPTITVVF